MDISNQDSLTMRRLAHGVIQWTMSIAITEMDTNEFRFENLELPANLEGAVKKRQLEFLCGRLCAKRALESQGLTQRIPSVLMGQDRIPIWPIGFTGSISHTDHLATAVVGRSSTVQWLGIDIERKIREVTAPLIQQICCDGDELTALVDAQPLSKEQALTVIFSAKESLYKAITPRDQRLLGFRDLRVYSLGPQDVKVMLLKDLGAPYKQGMTWGVEVRHLPDDLVETLVLKGWDGGGRS